MYRSSSQWYCSGLLWWLKKIFLRNLDYISPKTCRQALPQAVDDAKLKHHWVSGVCSSLWAISPPSLLFLLHLLHIQKKASKVVNTQEPLSYISVTIFWSVWVLNKVQESVLRYSDGYWWIIGNRPCLLYIFHWPRLVWQALYQLSSLQASPKPSSLKFCWFFFSNFFWVSFICSCFSFFYFTEFCSYIFFCLLWAYFSLSGFLKVENWFVIAFLFWYTHTVLYTFLQSLLSFVIHFDIMYSYLCSGKNVLQFPSVLIIWPCCLVSKSDL